MLGQWKQTLFVTALLFGMGTAHAKKGQGEGENNFGPKNCGVFTVKSANQNISMVNGGVISAQEAGQQSIVRVEGTYVRFDLDLNSFSILNWTYKNLQSVDGTQRDVVVYKSKTPRLSQPLSSDTSIQSSESWLVMQRQGAGVSLKIQARDCTTGGVFQMETETADNSEIIVEHQLGDDVFYFDNPFFRNRAGESKTFGDVKVTVSPRVNIGSDAFASLVGRDSPQEAKRIDENCVNTFTNNDGTVQTLKHCGATSLWSLKSGGRMGQVMGEDAVAAEPAQPVCTHKCGSQSQIKGQTTIEVGFPFPVPSASILKPDTVL